MKKLAGLWTSERGSRLELAVLEDSRLQGIYTRPPGKSQGSFPVVGMVDPAEHDGSRCLAFVVLWNNEHLNQHSISAWCGQYRVVQDEAMLDMTWLLTEESTPEADWTSTRVGKDIFRQESGTPHR